MNYRISAFMTCGGQARRFCMRRVLIPTGSRSAWHTSSEACAPSITRLSTLLSAEKCCKIGPIWLMNGLLVVPNRCHCAQVGARSFLAALQWQMHRQGAFPCPNKIHNFRTQSPVERPIYPWCFFARAIASRRRAVRPERFRLSVIHRRIFGQSFSLKGTE